MAANEVLQKVQEIIAGHFNISADEIKPEDNIAKAYGAKSHDMIQLSAGLQAAYGVKISYIQSRSAKTVQDWVNLVESLRK